MKKYFISLDNKPQGPFTFEELKEKNVTRKTLIWFEGCEEWTEAGDIEEVASIITITPPPIKSNDEKKEILKVKIAKSIKWNIRLALFTLPLIPLTYVIVAIVFGGFQANNYQELDVEKLDSIKTEIEYTNIAQSIENDIYTLLPDDKKEMSRLWTSPLAERIIIDTLTLQEAIIRFFPQKEDDESTLSEKIVKRFFEKIETITDLSKRYPENPIIINRSEEFYDYQNISFDRSAFYSVTEYLIKRAFGWENIKICLIVFLVVFFASYVFIGLVKAIRKVKDFKNWLDKYSSTESITETDKPSTSDTSTSNDTIEKDEHASSNVNVLIVLVIVVLGIILYLVS